MNAPLNIPSPNAPGGPPAGPTGHCPRVRRGFSLVEILLSIFILGIGMIMVASIFPVGANWTRQATEETIGQAISQNAVTVLEQVYGPGGLCYIDMHPPAGVNTVIGNIPDTPFKLQALPGFTKIPLDQRSYQFGNSNPFPAPLPPACTYFWTALCRLNPSHQIANPGTNNVFPASSYKYDVYILVFRKGDANQEFSAAGTEVKNMRLLPLELFVPRVDLVGYQAGVFNPNTSPAVTNAMPPVGSIGIGDTSGTVFRQGFDLATSHAVPRPLLRGQQTAADPPSESIIYAPGPDQISGNSIGTTSYDKSPLIYVYQTTLNL